MAESARTRKMLDSENSKLVKLQIEARNWREDIRRGAPNRGATAHVQHHASAFDGDMGAFGKDTTRSEQKLPAATEKDLGLMNLCSKIEDSKQFFSQVVETITSMKDCDLTVLDWNIFGNKYISGRYVEFLIAFYSVGTDTKIDMKRMSGDGFAMASFFTEVKNHLKQSDLIIAAEEDDEEFAYSTDEDDDDSGDDDDNLGDGYLQLAYDPNIVQAWIQKIQNRHVEDQLHMMGLMAFNASNKQNLDIIVKKGGKNLKTLFVNKFENSNLAALLRFTSELAKHVTGHPDCKDHGYDEDFLIALFDTIKYWIPGRASSSVSDKSRQLSTKFVVTESRETVMNLIQTTYNLGEKMKIFSEETIVRFAKKRLEKKPTQRRNPKDDILRFLETREETKPVKYFRHILKQI